MRRLSKSADTMSVMRRVVSDLVDRPTGFLVARSRRPDRGAQEVFIPNLGEASGLDPEVVHSGPFARFYRQPQWGVTNHRLPHNTPTGPFVSTDVP